MQQSYLIKCAVIMKQGDYSCSVNFVQPLYNKINIISITIVLIEK
jgi:hypothetical protein